VALEQLASDGGDGVSAEPLLRGRAAALRIFKLFGAAPMAANRALASVAPRSGCDWRITWEWPTQDLATLFWTRVTNRVLAFPANRNSRVLFLGLRCFVGLQSRNFNFVAMCSISHIQIAVFSFMYTFRAYNSYEECGEYFVASNEL
jgi:hypothetical protein